MKTYQIEHYELHCSVWEIQADNEVEALNSLQEGKGELLDGLEYIEMAENYGYPSERFYEKCRVTEEQKTELAFDNGDYLATIRSIKEV